MHRVQNPLQSFDFHNIIAFSALQIVPQRHGSKNPVQAAPIAFRRTGVDGLGQKGVYRHRL